MSTALLITLVVALLLASLAINSILLWLCARLWRIPAISLKRAAYTVLALSVLQMFVPILLLVAGRWMSEDVLIFSGVIVLILSLIACLAILRRMLSTSYKRAAGVGLCAWVMSAAATLTVGAAFRTWAAEAFSIPTGAMAPTLLGVHADIECGNCGYAFAVNLSHRMGDFDPLSTVTTATCPNCATDITIPPDERQRNGDRVSVDKVKAVPRRWDLAVFDNPEEPEVQYIKRVVGLPGEQIDIAGGEIFADGQLQQKNVAAHADLWVFVHDTSYRPNSPDPKTPGWRTSDDQLVWPTAEEPWGSVEDQARRVTFEGRIYAERAYNPAIRSPHGRPTGRRAPPVGDVRLDCTIADLGGNGSLTLRWAFGDREISATITQDGATIQHADNEGQADPKKTKGNPFTQWPGSNFSLVVRDGQAAILQDDQVVCHVSTSPATKADAIRLIEQSLASRELSITGSGVASLSRIQLWRDVYWLSLDELGKGPDMIELPLALDSEYFMLGDNSNMSKDSRFFGPVHARAITGVARWIYWPPTRMTEFE